MALERWAAAGRAARLARGTGSLPPPGLTQIDYAATGHSLAERIAFVMALVASGVTIWLVGGAVTGLPSEIPLWTRVTAGLLASIGPVVMVWLVALVLCLPLVLAGRLFAGNERAWIARLPLVIDGYHELLERARLVKTVRARITFAPPLAAEPTEAVRDAIEGAGFGAGARVTGAGAIVLECALPASSPLAVRRWFRALAQRVLLPVAQVYPIGRVELEDA